MINPDANVVKADHDDRLKRKDLQTSVKLAQQDFDLAYTVATPRTTCLKLQLSPATCTCAFF